MEAKCVYKYARIAPRKARLVLTAIQGKPVAIAMSHIRVLNKKAARMVEKVLKSALANAENKKMDLSKLSVKEVRADGGPSYKRIMTRSMGRADRIKKRTTHITVILEDNLKLKGTQDSTEKQAKENPLSISKKAKVAKAKA